MARDNDSLNELRGIVGRRGGTIHTLPGSDRLDLAIVVDADGNKQFLQHVAEGMQGPDGEKAFSAYHALTDSPAKTARAAAAEPEAEQEPSIFVKTLAEAKIVLDNAQDHNRDARVVVVDNGLTFDLDMKPGKDKLTILDSETAQIFAVNNVYPGQSAGDFTAAFSSVTPRHNTDDNIPLPPARPLEPKHEPNPNVEIAQRGLANAGFDLDVDGDKGPQTNAAITKFKKDHSIEPANAELDDKTLKALQAETDNVKRAQQELKDRGYDLKGRNGGVDGIRGESTIAAIEDFQSKNNLEVTGKLNEKTLEALEAQGDKTKAAPAQGDKIVATALPPVNEMDDPAPKALPAAAKQNDVAAWLKNLDESHPAARDIVEPFQPRHPQETGVDSHLQEAANIGRSMTTKGNLTEVAANDDVPAALAGGKQKTTSAGVTV